MDLGDRMKGYEKAYKISMPERMPVIVRIDGKAFHTVTRGMEKPFDERMTALMSSTAQRLVSEMQNAVLAYVQSDEISILMTNYKKRDTDSWFGNSIQKIASVSAGIATYQFNKDANILDLNLSSLVTFDSRAFVLPKEEVANYFIWRQQDATRNSIQSLGQSVIGHKKIQGLNNKQVQEVLMADYNINWNDLSITDKRGRCVVKSEQDIKLDAKIPIFTEDRDYIEKLVFIDME